MSQMIDNCHEKKFGLNNCDQPVFIERMHNCRQTFTIGFLCNVNID